MPFIQSKNPENDPGEWFVWGRSDGKDIRFRVRRLLPEEAMRIEDSHGVTRRDMVVVGSLRSKAAGGARKGDVVVPGSSLRPEIEAGLDMAVRCLADSENCVVLLGGPEDAAEYQEVFGGAVVVEAGKPLRLDGLWGNEKLRRLFLRKETEVAARVVWHARRTGAKAVEEEQEAEEGKDAG